jgi:hypothetical protein
MIDFNRSDPNANEESLDILAKSFRGLLVLQMSIGVRGKEVKEVLKLQPLAPIWRNCGSTLKALDLSLVWFPLEEDEAPEFNECSELDEGSLECHELEGNANKAAVIFKSLVASYDFQHLEKLTLRGWGPGVISAELVESKFPSLRVTNVAEISVDGAVP